MAHVVRLKNVCVKVVQLFLGGVQMNRHTLRCLAVLVLAGIAVLSGPALAAEHDHAAMANRTAKTSAECMVECNQAFHHCFMQIAAGKKEHSKAAHAALDCAEMCSTSAALCARMSPMMAACCEACAKCCDACAAECEKLNDPALKACIDACRKTAKECREMAK